MGHNTGNLNWKRYEINRDGKQVNKDKRYFVLNVDDDRHAKRAFLDYARYVKKDNPELSKEMMEMFK